MPEETAVTATGSSKSIAVLRRDYERLANECDKAHKVKNQPEVDRLMRAKSEAHTLWHNAVMVKAHAERDAMKAAGRKPGNF